LFAYGRARNLTEFRQLLASHKTITAAFEIDDSWGASGNGRINDPRSHEPSGAHTIRIVGYNDADRVLYFANSWGVNWGDEGYGYLPYAYLDQRLLEAWYQDLGRPASEESSSASAGKIMFVTGVLNALGRVLHVVEQVDLATDEIMGWALAVEIENVLHVDELFVRSAYRGRGLGRRLATKVAAISAKQGQQLRLWISHVDWAGEATPAQAAIIASLGLTSLPCSERWASRVAMRTLS
jgi:GNAT superfamily N-acetyltransferase